MPIGSAPGRTCTALAAKKAERMRATMGDIPAQSVHTRIAAPSAMTLTTGVKASGQVKHAAGGGVPCLRPLPHELAVDAEFCACRWKVGGRQ